MATHDYVIANQSGAAFRTDLNNALAAIVSNNSNSSSPSTTYAYQWWADTSAGVLKIRNSANNAWIELLQLDGTLTLEDGSASTPALAFRDDLNTGIYSSAADTFNVATGGVERMELGATTIFNEDGENVDFRIESDSNTHMFFVDAGNNNIGINTSSPSKTLVINENDSECVAIIKSSDTGTAGLFLGGQSDEIKGGILFNNSTNNLTLQGHNNSTAMAIDSSGRVGIGTTTPDSILDITSASPFITFNSNDAQLTQDELIGGMKVFKSDASGSGTGICGSLMWRSDDAVGARTYLAFTIRANSSNQTNTDTECARIDGGGRLLVGTTDANSVSARLVCATGSVPGYYANPAGLSVTTGNSADANCVEFFQGRYNKRVLTLSHSYNQSVSFAVFEQADVSVGSITGDGSNTSFNESSDYRLKENIVNITDGITRLKQLIPRRFNWIADSTNTLRDGFIAHEVSAIIPEAVTGEKDAQEEDGSINPQQMDYSKLTPLLTAALQEAIAKIEVLETKVAALEAS